MMLDGKVVAVLGVGPGVGRSVALTAARQGADVVLAARTQATLDDVAKEVGAAGRRALPVAVDLTSAQAGPRLVTAAMEGFGRVDAVVYNALVMPPIRQLMDVDLDGVESGLSANAITALRLIRDFVPSLTAPGGSVVVVGSMVIRFSQVTMAPYKMAKAAMHAMAGSLATELGPRGIRVNTVAPGHILGDSLRWYFSYLAHKRGVSVDAIQEEVIAGSDLRRLVEPDDVAGAVAFLVSDMAGAITGQTLDVNCGEYHH